jgi:hypothetical protein
MRLLIANTDYPAYLKAMYSGSGNRLAAMSYQDQLRTRRDSLFGVSSFYADALSRQGHPAMEVYINNGHMQRRWLRERGTSPRTFARNPGVTVSIACTRSTSGRQ